MNINGIEFYTSLEEWRTNKIVAVVDGLYGEGKNKKAALEDLKEKIVRELQYTQEYIDIVKQLLTKINNIDWGTELVTFPDAVVEGEEIAVTPPTFPLPKDLDVVGTFSLDDID